MAGSVSSTIAPPPSSLKASISAASRSSSRYRRALSRPSRHGGGLRNVPEARAQVFVSQHETEFARGHRSQDSLDKARRRGP